MVYPRLQSSWLLLAGVAGASGLAVPACSSSFAGCENSRDCGGAGAGSAGQSAEAGSPGEAPGSSGGSGGSGGLASGAPDGGSAPEAGGSSAATGALGADAGASGDTAGAGGEPPKVACVMDSECSDHLACDGVETCQLGVCVPGVPPCTNPEPAHCDVVCTEVGGAASCGVRGQDKDKDGHFTSACMTKPGDDCNDAAPTVYTGAPELCDGIDNNCNGKIDLNDGVPPSGTTVAIGPASAKRNLPTIAWATDKSVYGIAYHDVTTSSTADLYFEEVDKTGAVTLQPEAFNDTATKLTPLVAAAGLSLVWGGDTFGAAWDTPNAVYLRPIASNGSLAAAPFRIPADNPVWPPATARDTLGNWLVLYENRPNSDSPNTISANEISAQGVVGIGVPLAFNETPYFDIAPLGGNLVLAYDTLTTTTVGIFPANLADQLTVNQTSYDSVLASGPSGFAIAGHPSPASTAWSISLYKTSGELTCGPVGFPAGFVPSSIVATPTGYLAVAGGVLRVQEILANCTLGTAFTLDAGPSDYSASIAGSATTGYGVVWQDSTSNVPKRRLFGPHFCD